MQTRNSFCYMSQGVDLWASWFPGRHSLLISWIRTEILYTYLCIRCYHSHYCCARRRAWHGSGPGILGAGSSRSFGGQSFCLGPAPAVCPSLQSFGGRVFRGRALLTHGTSYDKTDREKTSFVSTWFTSLIISGIKMICILTIDLNITLSTC